jgi:tetratricopeptide (TPR) repeat protein
MSRTRIGFAITAALALLGAAPAADPEALLREGNEAFARGDFARAAALYEKAEVRATDPSLVAFNLAAAKYRLAEADGSPQALLEAEQAYRCCVEPGAPRRAEALYGLGNCLLLKAGDHDGAALKAAIACYDRCLREAGPDEALADDVRYNRARARLALQQLLAQSGRPKDERPSSDDENPERPDRSPLQNPDGDLGPDGQRGTQAGPAMVKPGPGQGPVQTDDRPPGGQGTLPPVPDRAEPAPLSPQDAAAHLELANRRILEERQAHRRGNLRPPAPAVRDW